MIIKVIRKNNIYICIYSLLIFISVFYLTKLFLFDYISVYSTGTIWNELEKNNTSNSESSYIKWVDFTPTYQALNAASKIDIDSHNNSDSKVKYNWIELLAYLACKYGGNFKNFNIKDLNLLIEKLENGSSIEDITKDLKYYSYYYEAYDAVLHGFLGDYEIETLDSKTGEKIIVKKYGIKAFLPIAKNYNFSHYNDFGVSRSYGYKREHLGNDLMGSIGTPIIAVESGTIEALGWNQYGGWRIGIRSFDKKRYYYYAHLRKDHPYVSSLEEGQIIRAGDVIGYLGMTGYSTKENVNNINVPHLHFGMQLIFDESQKDGTNQIWIDVYQIIEFLRKNSSEVYKDSNSKDFIRKFEIFEPKLYEL